MPVHPDERIANRISTAELTRRWTAVCAAMAERGIEALVLQSANDWLGGYVKWFTDIPATNGYPRSVVFHADDLMTVVEIGPFGGRQLLDGNDPIHRGVGEVLTSPSFASIGYTHAYDGQLVAEAIRRRGIRAVGLLGGKALPAGFVAAVADALPDRRGLSEASDFVDAIKAIKSEEEIGLIRRTAAVQDEVFAAILAAIKPGMRDVDVAALAWHEGQIRGSEQGIVLGASAPLGARSSFVGRHMQGRTLRPGDHLSLLIEINGPGGLYTEIARTVVLGRASAELREAFAAMREAQETTLRRMRPGAACREIAAAHDTLMTGRGLPPELRLYSHGQGYDMVERPLIRRDETMTLAAGMNLAVHPGYETERLFAVICDNYLIGPSGPGQCLHRTEKTIFELT
jgi:Xaa-Pro aminopeptidase